MNAKDEVVTYISSKERTGALLLTGKWGCGKTFLIHQIQEELNSGSQYAVVLVSLFGIESIEGLNKKVKESVFKIMMGSMNQNIEKSAFKKVKTAVSALTSTLSEVSNTAKGLNTVLSINPYDFITIERQVFSRKSGETIKKELVLMFDDFERSRINKIDLLGAINDYSENKDIKTVLIADENHIAGEEYKDFKEKLISRTVKLSADYTNAICEIVKNYRESASGYQNFLKENIALLTLVFLESGTENLRSFKSFLLDFERVYLAWMGSDVPTTYLPNILCSFGAVLFEFKDNNYTKDEKYGYLFKDGEIKKKYTECKDAYILNSLRNWIVEGDWNKKAFLDEIKQKFYALSMSADQIFLYHEFWDLTQEAVFEGLPVALERAYRGQLGRDELVRLIQRVFLLKKYAIVSQFEIDFQKISQGLDIREEMMKNGDIIEDPCGTFIVDEVLWEMDTPARELYHRIEKMEDRCTAWCNRRKFISFMENGTVVRHELKYNYLISFDKELLDIFFATYKKQGNGHKRELILCLKDFVFSDKQLSTNADIKETIDNIKMLEELICDLLKTEQDAIARVNISETLNVLPEIIQLLEDYITAE